METDNISPYCLKYEGTTTGEYLARYVEEVLEMDKWSVTTFVSDCEPSMPVVSLVDDN